MDRPSGVSFLAACSLFLGGVFLLGAVLVPLLGLGIAWLGFFLPLAGIALLNTFGLWKLRSWARTLTIIMCALTWILLLLNLVFRPAELRFGGLFLLMLAVMVWAVWYLTRPEVKKAFGLT